MPETHDDAPSVSGPASPSTWTLGYAEDAPGGMKCVAERYLSDEEYERYHESVSFVLNCKGQASLKLVLGNYREFRAIQSSMAIIFTTTKQANWPESQDSVFHLCRILLNWLNSIRLFDDHTRARIVRTYGDPSPELSAFMAVRAAIYDEVPGYRFMFEMRNYAQHCGVVPVQAQIHQNASGTTLDLYFDRDQLLREFGNWKRVKPDLEAGPQHIAIDSPIEESMAAVTRLAQAVATIDEPRFATSIETIKEIMGPPLDDPNRRKTIFKMAPPSADASWAQQMRMLFAPAMEVQPGPADAEPAIMDVPDFTSHRPALTTEYSTRECQGPLNKVTHLPAESCTERATMALFFPHQEGVAFLFGCHEHALALGQWAGKKFGDASGGRPRRRT